MRNPHSWPALPQVEVWQDTLQTVHMWTQIVGKLRLAQEPYANHFWHVPLYVNACGLTTSPIAYEDDAFQIDFDFIHHQLSITCASGAGRTLPLEPRSVADFYRALMQALAELEIEVPIWPVPCEVPDPIPFLNDELHAAYNPAHAEAFFHALWQAHRVLTEFRGHFIGKASPVHFFWGGFDLAVTRFSGRTAPEHPPVPNIPLRIVREAYSHEVSSAGFWPGTPGLIDAAFYSYAYPEPPAFRDRPVRPFEAYFHEALGEFVLPYAAVQSARDPDAHLLEFLQSSYEAAADLGRWDRTVLEHGLMARAAP